MRIALKALVLLTLFAFSTTIAFGQADTGQIAGTVRDSSGAVVARAGVVARNLETGATRPAVRSGDYGQYLLPGLAPGTYEVTVTGANFAPYKSRVQVTVGAHITLDPTLTVDRETTTVEVVAAGGTEVNAQSPEVSQIITPQQILQLPSLTRNPYDFVATAGNVSGGDRSFNSGNPQTGGGGQNLTDRGVGFWLNGQRSSGTEVLLDGVENTNIFDTTIALIVPLDAVQEFRVITNNFDAQYGRASGGIVNVTTKTGTNAFHGSAWEFNRISALTANTYDNDANGNPKGQYTRNQFGFSLGGPVIKDKLFIFASTEWLRVRSNAVYQALVPTQQFIGASAANVQQFFSTYGGGVSNLPVLSTLTKQTVTTDPATGAAIAPTATLGGNLIGTSGPFFNLPDNTPIFNLVSYKTPAEAGGDVPQNTYNLVMRADYNFSDKTQMYFRFGRENLFEFPGTVFNIPYAQYNVGETILDNSFLYSVSHTFSSNVFSNTKLSFLRDTVAYQFNPALVTAPTLFLFNGATINGQPVNLPGFFDSFTSTGGLPYGGPQNTVQINEDLSWIKGKHTIRYGGQVNYIQLNRAYGAFNQAIEQLGTGLSDGLDNFLTGTLANYQVAVNPQGQSPCFVQPYTGPTTPPLIPSAACTLTPPLAPPSFSRSDRYIDWAVYLQDSWRVRPRLTFNYGLRYEYYGVQHNNNQNLDSNFYFGPTNGNFFEGVRTGSLQIAPQSPVGGLWHPNYGTVAPRLGFAWDIFGNGSTSLRGGYGISYERNFGNVTFNVIQNPPAYATPQLSGVPVSVSNYGPLNNSGVTSVLLPPVSPRGVDPNIDTAQTQFWGLTLERRLGRKAIVALEYNGAHGVHLYDIKNINEIGGGQAYLGDPFNGTYLRPNQQFTSINERGSQGFSHYNGLNVRFQTQNLGKTGLSIVANYTWSHSLDNISSTFSESSSSGNGIGNFGYLDPRNPALDYGNSDFDVRQRFTTSIIWEEPFFKTGRGWKRQLLGGYTIVPVFQARTGIPFTVSDGTYSLNYLTSGIPRYIVPGQGVPTYRVSGASTVACGAALANGLPPVGCQATPNAFNILSLYPSDSAAGIGPLGISDFGPFPAAMTARNAFRGPGAWNLDLAASKSFAVSERLKLEFRAEAFNILNHHNLYVNGYFNDQALFGAGEPIVVQGKKGGLAGLSANGNHDERRFIQLAARVMF